MKKIRLLLAEDEPVLAEVIKESVEQRGFDICHAANGVEAWTLFQEFEPHVCVIDVMLPRKDGFSLAQDIRRKNPDIPLIFLTAKTQTADVLKGFACGCDDYLKKPFSMEELVARIRALIKRYTGKTMTDFPDASPSSYRIGRIYSFDYQKMELKCKDKATRLSQREADVLKLLVLHPNKLIERKEVLLKLWGDDNFYNARNMDVYISKLRNHLRHDPDIEIINIRGRGFKMLI